MCACVMLLNDNNSLKAHIHISYRQLPIRDVSGKDLFQVAWYENRANSLQVRFVCACVMLFKTY